MIGNELERCALVDGASNNYPMFATTSGASSPCAELISSAIEMNFLFQFSKIWCFAMQHAVLLIVNTLHSTTERTPIQHFSGGKQALPPSKAVIWGSKMRIIKSKKSNKALESRTGGDPREVFNYDSLNAPLKLKSHDGIFLGYGNNVRVMLCYKPKTKRIVRCRHAIIDEHGATLQDPEQPLTPSEHMLRYYPTIESLSEGEIKQLPPIEIKPSDLDFITTPFDASKCTSLEIMLPKRGTDRVGGCGAVHPVMRASQIGFELVR